MSDTFKVCVSIIILVTFINSFLSIYTDYRAFDIIDDMLIIFYVIEIIIKIVGMGPENFFKDPWNKLDSLLITIGLAL